ncbi:DUF5697 family protein [Massiliimalia massiliensis]|uniref:DUF5697 family protein n=1 Tax=Massiliimalia massiliensis TaxID=1852384 RepID=UPI000987142E|nr:DUF5697 family protein [Massiliimalia massiliensis]
MFLSKPQKELLEILKQVGSLKELQAKKLIEMKYAKSNWETTAHQLACNGKIYREQGYITLPNQSIDQDIINAVDIMLLIESCHIEIFIKGTKPFSLTFFRQREHKLWRYDICPVPVGKEMIICALLEGINCKYRTIVFLLEKLEQRPCIDTVCDHCFVQKSAHTYHFYK